MYYTVKDEEFKIGTRKGEHRSALKALEAAIASAKVYAELEDVDVLKIDGTEVHVAYTVDKRPHKQRGLEDGWNDITPQGKDK